MCFILTLRLEVPVLERTLNILNPAPNIPSQSHLCLQCFAIDKVGQCPLITVSSR